MRKDVELLDRNTDERFCKLDIVMNIGPFNYAINNEIIRFNDCLSQIYQHNLTANFTHYIRQLCNEIIKFNDCLSQIYQHNSSTNVTQYIRQLCIEITNLSTKVVRKISCTIYNN